MKNRNLMKKILALILGIPMLLPVCVTGAVAEDKKIFLSENFALDQAVVANNSYSSQPQESAVDGDRSSFWRTLSSWKDSFVSLIIPFGEETDINLVYLRPYQCERMTSVKIQYTTDPAPSATSEWIDVKVFDKNEISNVMRAGFDTVIATGMRFYADVTQQQVGLYEIEFYYTNDAETAIEQLLDLDPDIEEFTQSESVDATLVSVGENGELVYKDYDGKGATLIDYSYAGYKRGEEDIPDVKVVKTIEPGDLADHTALIQNTIDEVAALPESERGAILLRAGTYVVSSQINITSSGIVLRGEGQGENGTVIYDNRTQNDIVTLKIKGSSAYTVVFASRSTLVESYLPMGKTELKLSSVDAYKVGDTIRVSCTPNKLWVQTLGMDVIPGSGKTQWTASDYVMTYERVITAVDSANSTVTIDTGIPLTLDKTYYSVMVHKIQDSKDRITGCGVENIRFLSGSFYIGFDNLENHAWSVIAISLSNCRDCFVRDVTAKHYAKSTVFIGGGAINVTVEGCSYIEPVSALEGGARYSFDIGGGQYTLVKNCYSYNSRHDYVINSRVAGPNVFVDCVAEDGNAAVEAHQRWSTGTLYDNIYVIGSARLGYIQFINRGSYGSGHGWAAANSVIWNCLSPAILVGKPQTEQNFAVGAYGIYDVSMNGYLSGYKQFIEPTIVTPNYPETQSFEGSPLYGNGYIESPYNPVNPSSLYKAQLSYRLYGDATKNVTPGAPILNLPRADEKSKTYAVKFSGVADFNADTVYVYVNGEKHQAEFAADGGNAYSLELNLENGYHDIYVTQVIDGIESSANATRTILVASDVPYVPESQTGENDNTGNGEKDKNLVLPIAVGVGAAVAAVAAVGTVLTVKKKKKSK